MEKRFDLTNILKSFNENRNSHIFLIETNSVSKATSDIKQLIINILKITDKNVEEQINDESFVDLYVVRPEKNLISKDQISLLKNYLKTKAVIYEKKFYIIENSELMNEYSSNMLLKQIEEPEVNIVGFLITENINSIIPTIKSRCHHLVIKYNLPNDEQKNDKYSNIANNFLELVKENNLFKFHQFKNKNIELIEDVDYFINCLCDKNLSFYNNSKHLSSIYIKFCKSIMYFYTSNRKNMNSSLLLEKLYINLKKVI